MLIVKGVARALAQTVLLAALLLVPAGTWHWPRALQFLVAFGVVGLISTVALALTAPSSLEARVELPPAGSQPAQDRVVALLLGVALVAWFVFIPVDVFHLHLLGAPPAWTSLLAAALLVAGYGIMYAALIRNAFASPLVADQAERGQVLVDTGLFAHVRHPMYLGAILFFAGLGLWLESAASLLALPVVAAALVARIFVEERSLRETLPGYAEYTGRVRYRLVPLVW